MELLSVTTACPLTTEQVERERERERERVSTGLHEYKHSRVQSLLLMITLTSTTELFCTAFKISDRSEVRACIFLKLAITSNATSKTDDHYPITWPMISIIHHASINQHTLPYKWRMQTRLTSIRMLLDLLLQKLILWQISVTKIELNLRTRKLTIIISHSHHIHINDDHIKNNSTSSAKYSMITCSCSFLTSPFVLGFLPPLDACLPLPVAA